jgi:hypothetical protein
MSLIFVVSLVAAVHLVAAGRYHPICNVLEMVALVRYVDSGSADNAELRDVVHSAGEVADESNW